MGTFFPKQTSFAQLLVTSSELLVHSLCFGFVLIIYWPDSLHSFSKVYVLLTRFHLFGGRDHVPQNLVCLITKKKKKKVVWCQVGQCGISLLPDEFSPLSYPADYL